MIARGRRSGRRLRASLLGNHNKPPGSVASTGIRFSVKLPRMRIFDVLNRWQAVAVAVVLVLSLSTYLLIQWPERATPSAPLSERTESTAASTTGFEGTAQDEEGTTRLDTTTEQQTGAVRADNALPERGSLPAGRYVTDEFEPTFSFRVGEGWEVAAPEMTDFLAVRTALEGGQLMFTNPRTVFDPSVPSEEREVPAPENADEWVSWFQRHPNLDTSNPVPTSMGGVSGMVVDTTVSSAPSDYPRGRCATACVPLYAIGDRANDAFVGQRDRFIIVDVGGDTLLVDISAPLDEFEGFFPEARNVLATVEREGA